MIIYIRLRFKIYSGLIYSAQKRRKIKEKANNRAITFNFFI
jgi:hypothetical protein